MEQWIQEGLSRILDFEVPDDLIQYVMHLLTIPATCYLTFVSSLFVDQPHNSVSYNLNGISCPGSFYLFTMMESSMST